MATVASLLTAVPPIVVPSVLPWLEYGKDRVYHLAGPPYDVPNDGKGPTVCLEYSVEGEPSGPRVGPVPPTLCLEFKGTPQARSLVGGQQPIDGPG